MSDSSLYYHQFDDCLWIRCESRGSFINSPVLKSVAEKYLASGGRLVVVDLELCPGVDSTFMGTLAGLARQADAVDGTIEIASPTPRTRAAMEGLGLDMLVFIAPDNPVWSGNVEWRRAQLAQHEAESEAPRAEMTELERTRHVLDAHNTLRAMNPRNDEAFGYVCDTLKEDIARQTREPGNN